MPTRRVSLMRWRRLRIKGPRNNTGNGLGPRYLGGKQSRWLNEWHGGPEGCDDEKRFNPRVIADFGCSAGCDTCGRVGSDADAHPRGQYLELARPPADRDAGSAGGKSGGCGAGAVPGGFRRGGVEADLSSASSLSFVRKGFQFLERCAAWIHVEFRDAPSRHKLVKDHFILY